MSPPELRRKSPSRCSSSLRVLRRQGAAQHNQREAASRQAMLAFRSLDPFRALPEPDRRRRDEERLSRSEQRTLSKTQNNHLTGKAPYKSRANLTSWWILAGAEEVDRLFAVSRKPARPKPGHRESSGTAISPSSTISRACPAQGRDLL